MKKSYARLTLNLVIVTAIAALILGFLQAARYEVAHPQPTPTPYVDTITAVVRNVVPLTTDFGGVYQVSVMTKINSSVTHRYMIDSLTPVVMDNAYGSLKKGDKLFLSNCYYNESDNYFYGCDVDRVEANPTD